MELGCYSKIPYLSAKGNSNLEQKLTLISDEVLKFFESSPQHVARLNELETTGE